MRVKIVKSILVLATVLGLAAAAPALLLNFPLDPNQPVLVFNNQGTTDFSGGVVSIDANALIIDFPDGTTAAFVPFGDLAIDLEVDAGCGFLSGGLVLTGTVIIDGAPVSGTLLTAVANGFGFEDSGGPTDQFDAVFEITGGELAPLWPEREVLVKVTSEESSFVGTCSKPFSGEAKGQLAATLSQQPLCCVDVVKTCTVIEEPSGDGACEAKIAATRLRYIGSEDLTGVDVEFRGKADGVVTYPGVDLVSGVTVLEMNGFTVDGRPDDLGSKMTITIDGVEEVVHTSCSTPYVAGLPAPLDNPKGAPSSNWLVEGFVDKNGEEVASVGSGRSEPTSKCTIAAKTDTKKKKKKKSKKGKKKASGSGSSGSGGEVTYTYEISNCGSNDVLDVIVDDDKIGVLTDKEPIPVIPVDGSVVLTATQTITENTTNIVEVTGVTPGTGQICMDMDSAKVIVEDREDPPSKKKSKKSKSKKSKSKKSKSKKY